MINGRVKWIEIGKSTKYGIFLAVVLERNPNRDHYTKAILVGDEARKCLSLAEEIGIYGSSYIKHFTNNQDVFFDFEGQLAEDKDGKAKYKYITFWSIYAEDQVPAEA